MKPTRSRLVALGALAAASALVMSGCTADTGSSDDTLTLAPVPEEEVTLTVWSFLPGNYDRGAEAYDAIIDAFNEEYPQVTVDLVEMPYPTYFDQVRNASVSRSGPDVITMYGGAQAYSYRNALYPLQDAIDPALADDLRYIDENYSQDGNLYILPTGAYGYALLVNQDLFAQAGVDPAAGLADWSSMLQTCQDLAAAGVQPFASGWQDGFQLETLLYMLSSQLMDAATLEQWTAAELPLTDPLFRTVIERVLEMDDAGCFGGEDALGRAMWDDAFNQYYAGDGAMLLAGGLSTAETGYASIPSTTVLPLPQAPESKHDQLIDAGAEAGWSVTRWTEHPEAAAAFVNFLAGDVAQGLLWEIANVPPNNAAVDYTVETPMQEVYLPLITNEANHTGFASFPLEVLAVVERNAVPLISGSMTVDEFLDQAVRAFERTS